MMTRTRQRLAAGMLAAAVGGLQALAPTPAAADPAGDFLKSMEGSYRGKGTAKLFGRERSEPVACQIENRFDAGSKALVVSGQCATAQAKSPVQGRISFSGANVNGALINAVDGATITKSVGTVASGQLVVTTNMVDNATGNLTRTRQEIQLSSNGFTARFFIYDNASAKFELSGTMAFSGS